MRAEVKSIVDVEACALRAAALPSMLQGQLEVATTCHEPGCMCSTHVHVNGRIAARGGGSSYLKT